MAVVLTVSICINVFQAIIFFLYYAGTRIKAKQVDDIITKLEKELKDE